jgi:hypothetical protein
MARVAVGETIRAVAAVLRISPSCVSTPPQTGE